MKNAGWESEHDGRVFTLFSAPNYCDNVGNLGAYAVITGKNLHVRTISYSIRLFSRNSIRLRQLIILLYLLWHMLRIHLVYK